MVCVTNDKKNLVPGAPAFVEASAELADGGILLSQSQKAILMSLPSIHGSFTFIFWPFWNYIIKKIVKRISMNWPEWYNWELEISSHVEKRMIQRNFNEIDLRTMLTLAQSYQKDIEEGRYLIKSKFNEENWEIIVEPDHEEKILVIISVCPKTLLFVISTERRNL